MNEYAELMKNMLSVILSRLEPNFNFECEYKDYNEFLNSPFLDDKEFDILYVNRKIDNIKILSVIKLENGEYLLNSYDDTGETIIYSDKITSPNGFMEYSNHLREALKL